MPKRGLLLVLQASELISVPTPSKGVQPAPAARSLSARSQLARAHIRPQGRPAGARTSCEVSRW